MWWYNIIGDNEGSISDLLRLCIIAAGSVLRNTKFVELKLGNPEPILTVKIIEWRKYISFFGLSIEAYPFRVVKNSVYFSILGI